MASPEYLPRNHSTFGNGADRLGPSLSPSNRTLVNEANVNGKLCYVYDDGSVCQKTINGDPVNPKWGTTKAGKPRKRLGQACNTCREKKIRCDPKIPKCTQCQKFDRECKFETSSRSSKNGASRESTSVPSTQDETHHERTGSSTSGDALTDRSYSRANSRGSMNVESLLSPQSTTDASPPSEQPPTKKLRLSSPPNCGHSSPTRPTNQNRDRNKIDSIKVGIEPSFTIDVDPMQIDARLTRFYLREYFKNVTSALSMLLPPARFMHWVDDERSKSPEDKLLLYAMVAAGATFSKHDCKGMDKRLFKTIAETALDQDDFQTLQVVQSRLIMSMLEYSLGHFEKSRQHSTGALQLAYRCGLNKEIREEEPKFGMSLATHLECRRRTFWLAMVSTCFLARRLGLDEPQEPFLFNCRLPGGNEAFENGEMSRTPYFEYTGSTDWEFPYAPQQGPLAFVVHIAVILHEVAAWLNASTRLSLPDYAGAYERMYQASLKKLSAWDERIREHYRQSGRSPTGLHTMYHFVFMALSRFARHEGLSSYQLERSCRESHDHAMRLLTLLHLMHDESGKSIPLADVTAGCPMTGHIIVMAVDIVTAAGTTSSLLEHQDLSFIELVSGGLGILDMLSQSWKTAEGQLEGVKPRIGAVLSGKSSGKAAWFVRKPLFSPFGLEYDVVYGVSRVRYLKALGYGHKVRGLEDFCEMDSQ
jgi:Fungal specific transcription factor domain/Fungal Zn(2)-Cys(6) binuclear cluster domain